ncbi:MAG: ribonuclease P protein component, partial [Fimbriimonadales bacterium]
AVSRSVGSQPRRNRARRRLREALRLSGALRQDADYVFVVGAGSASLPFEQLRRTAEDLLRRLNARCADSPSS